MDTRINDLNEWILSVAMRATDRIEDADEIEEVYELMDALEKLSIIYFNFNANQ